MVMRYYGPLPSEDIRQVPVPELALRLLRSFSPGADLNVNSLLRGAEQAFVHNNEPDSQFLLERLSDAWAWLEAHALIGPHEHQDPSTWRRVTSMGRKVAQHQHAVTEVWANERLAGDLHSILEDRVRPIFYLGDFETAAFAAMKAVEVEVRRLAGFDDSEIGVKLMRKAFGEKGPLRDLSTDPGEHVAVMELFAGAIGAFKNPASHRAVRFDDRSKLRRSWNWLICCSESFSGSSAALLTTNKLASGGYDTGPALEDSQGPVSET
jgi:uncharacterized protein (TIGR02391 family)